MSAPQSRSASPAVMIVVAAVVRGAGTAPAADPEHKKIT